MNNSTSNMQNRKRFNEYLFEFLMVFLAISAGFILENYREKLSEDKRAKILAKSLYEDLRKDSISLVQNIDSCTMRLKASEDMLEILHKGSYRQDDTAFYTYITKLITLTSFTSTEGTYEQMKASGALSFFDQHLVNQMNAYDNQIKKTDFRDKIVESAIWTFIPVGLSVYNFEVTGNMRFNIPYKDNLYINIPDTIARDKFINLVAFVKTLRKRSHEQYIIQLSMVTNLMKSLSKSYKECSVEV